MTVIGLTASFPAVSAHSVSAPVQVVEARLGRAYLEGIRLQGKSTKRSDSDPSKRLLCSFASRGERADWVGGDLPLVQMPGRRYGDRADACGVLGLEFWTTWLATGKYLKNAPVSLEPSKGVFPNSIGRTDLTDRERGSGPSGAGREGLDTVWTQSRTLRDENARELGGTASQQLVRSRARQHHRQAGAAPWGFQAPRAAAARRGGVVAL